MASLRRPSAAPRGQAAQVDSRRPPLPNNAQTQAKREARKSRVGDKIKKRMSMRYAGGSEDFTPNIPAVPGMPGRMIPPDQMFSFDPHQNVLHVDMPPGMGIPGRMPMVEEDEDPYGGMGEPEPYGQASTSRGGMYDGQGGSDVQDERIGRRGGMDGVQREEWDLEELSKDGVDVNQFIKKTLLGADKQEIERFKSALERQKQGTAGEMKRNVFRNYAEFVTMSKEIATLENDMLELKELLGQWKDLPQLMGMEATLAPTLDKDGKVERRRTYRNSTADLQQLYKAQLTNLWSTVEGSQKYLPLVPGRHLVFETHDFVELNAATYKAKQNVSIFLLNDLLLVAGKRRTKVAPGLSTEQDKMRARGRMVAERCWVLADLVVVDVKDTGELTNTIKIRRGKENCVYRTSRSEDKKALLAAFREVSAELSENKRKESEKEQKRRKSMWQGDASASPNPGLLSPTRPQSSIAMTMADSRDLRWIDDFGDELTMAIAMRDWDEAVNQVEKGENLREIAAPHASANEHLTTRLDHLRSHLLSQMLHDLSYPGIRKSNVCRLVSLLSGLGAATAARDTFLTARTDIMLSRVRDIRCEGDTSIYINELGIVCFTIIRHTGDWYMTAFKETALASGFVTWAKDQIETFANMFKRQVFVPTVDAQTADDCIKITATNNRKLLRDVGLDFTFLLSTLLLPASSSSSQPHPSFQMNAAQTPGAGYETPFTTTFTPEIRYTPLPDDRPLSGGTAPLSIRSPRKPKKSETGSSRASGASTPIQSSATPPPRNVRRGTSGMSSVRSSEREDDSDSLR